MFHQNQSVKQESRKRPRADEVNGDGYPGHESRDRSNHRETSSQRDMHSKPDSHVRPDPTRRLSPRDKNPRDYHPRDNFQRERDHAFSRSNYQYHDRDNYPPRDSVPVSRESGHSVRDSNSRDSPFKRANRERRSESPDHGMNDEFSDEEGQVNNSRSSSRNEKRRVANVGDNGTRGSRSPPQNESYAARRARINELKDEVKPEFRNNEYGRDYKSTSRGDERYERGRDERYRYF